jgi:hypothetical protein
MDAGNFYRGAAVGFTGAAGDTFATVEIGDYGYGFAGLESGGFVEVDEVAGEFMAKDAGVFEVGLGAFEGMEVGSADADAANPDDRLARAGERGIRFAVFELTWLYAD